MVPLAASRAGRSEPRPPAQVEAFLVDPVRDVSLAISVPEGADPVGTLGELLAFYRSADLDSLAATGHADPGQVLELRRFADSIFLLGDDGRLGEIDSGLRFRVDGQPSGIEWQLDGDRPIRIEVDRSRGGYSRNWPAYLTRRWGLRAGAYSAFVSSVVEEAYGREAGTILRLDTPDRIRRFLAAVSRRIHASPYETYSRYLEPVTPFKGCDQTLDRIIEGDGGICAEKAMALRFIAHAYGIPAEFVLGGEEASGSFPYRTLRAILDRPSFTFADTGVAQRHWQHYAVLFPLAGTGGDVVFCDVAASNIPFLCLDARGAAPHLDPRRRKPLRVTITLEPLDLYYHRIERRQDIPLDLYFAMEHLIDRIDLIQTIDNELGLLHAGDYWIGAVASRGRRERSRIVSEYEQFAARAGLDPATDLCISRELIPAHHPLAGRFLDDLPHLACRVAAADAGLRRRVDLSDKRYDLNYVVINLKPRPDRP